MLPSQGRSKFGIAIMAAGKGTRLKSKRPKVLHEVGGRPLLEHVVRAAAQVVSPADIVVIIGHEADKVRAAVEHAGVRFAIQAEQRGTGHAIISARETLQRYDHVLVLSGDVPLVRSATIEQLRDFHLKQRASMTILTAEPDDPAGYGRVIRMHSTKPDVTAIVEYKALTRSQHKAREINSGIYAFAAADLWKHIDKLSTNNSHGEYYLTDMAALLVKAKRKVVAVKAANVSEVLGTNTLAELVALDAAMRIEKCKQLLANGVTILRPETCTIDADVQIGPDTIIEPFVQITGKTEIGEDCRIRSYSVINNSQIGNGVTLKPGCVLEESRVASGAVIGPYSHFRPGCDVGEDARVGNFVEMKKTRLGRGSKANHLTYLGDALVGDHVNVGAGTIICNYDGVNKHTTRIEDGVFIGSDSTLVAPVTIGRGAYVAAASCVTEDVPADSLAIARSKQVNKEGWAANRRKMKMTAKK